MKSGSVDPAVCGNVDAATALFHSLSDATRLAILRRLAGEATTPFHYADYGNLATIGRHAAVVDLDSPLGPMRFSGYFAWIFWLLAHVYFLIGFRNRLVVLLNWAWAYWSYQRAARIILGKGGDGERPPAQPE